METDSELKRGILWLGSATLVMRLLDVAATLVVLALLTREQMGLASLSWTVAVVLEAFSGLGVGVALVQAPKLSQDQTDSLFWFTTGVGVLLAVGMSLSAPWIAEFYADERLVPMIVVSASKLVFVGIAVVPLQLLAKQLRFRESGAVQTLATALEAITKIGLALGGLGAWSLVWSNTARGLFLLLALALIAPYLPRLHFVFNEIRALVAFGLKAAASGVIYQGYRNADYFFVGRFLGLEALGVYRVAFDIAMQPLELILNVVNRVAFPIYSKLTSQPKELARAFFRSSRTLVLLVGPVIVCLFFAGEQVLELVTHDRWLAAVPALQILVWAALLRGLSQMLPQVFHARGKPEYAIVDSVVSLVVLLGGFWMSLTWFGERWGSLAVCWVWLCAYPLLFSVQLLLAARLVPIGPGGVARALLPALGGLVAMCLVIAPLSYWLGDSAHAAVTLTALCVSGLAAYFAYLRIALGMTLRDLSPRRQTGAVVP